MALVSQVAKISAVERTSHFLMQIAILVSNEMLVTLDRIAKADFTDLVQNHASPKLCTFLSQDFCLLLLTSSLQNKLN